MNQESFQNQVDAVHSLRGIAKLIAACELTRIILCEFIDGQTNRPSLTQTERFLKQVLAHYQSQESSANDRVTVWSDEMIDDNHVLHTALIGANGASQQAIAAEVVRWGALMLRKNADYGGSVWDRPLLAPDCEPGIAIRVRMSDKLSRLISLLGSDKPPQVTSESIDDTLRDLGAYCLLELARPGRDNG